MPNRAARRKQAREEKHISQDACRLAAPEQYRLGFTDGHKECVKACYAAVCKTFAEKTDWDTDKIIDFLTGVDDYIVTCIESEEAIQDAFEAAGIQLNFTETFSNDRITTREVS